MAFNAIAILVQDFDAVMNKTIHPTELIAKFLDEKLHAGNKGISEEELEGMLDDAKRSMISKLNTERGSQTRGDTQLDYYKLGECSKRSRTVYVHDMTCI